MACSRFNGLVGVVIGASLLVSSTGAIAATSTAPVHEVNPWAVLAVMSGTAPAAVLCGSVAAAAAAQTPGTGCVLPVTDTTPAVVQTEPPPPIPVPPVEAAGGGLGLDPLLLALGAILAGAGLYFLLKKKTNSPA